MTCISNFPSLKNIFGMNRGSYAVSEKHEDNNFTGKVASAGNSPVKLLTYRRADLATEHLITQQTLSLFDIGENFVAVRVQNDKFTDLKNNTIQGHKKTLAKVRDWYNPYQNHFGMPMGQLRSSSDIANEERRNAINVMLMEKNDFEKKVLHQDSLLSKYGGDEKKKLGSCTIKRPS